MKRFRFFTAVILVILAGCADNNVETAGVVNVETADVIYSNGKIYTVNESQPWAEAVALKDGKFLLVGTNDEILAMKGAETEIIDLQGKFVMPGMIDVHTHAIESHVPAVARLSDAGDADKIVQQIKAHIEADPDKEWYLFGDFGFGLFPGDNGPKELLDDIAPGKAIAVMHASGHAFWANSKALELAGITAATPDPEMGIIARKPNGEAQGGLQESAMVLIWNVAPAFTPEEVEASVEYVNKMYAAAGITATREAGTVPERWDVVEKMAEEGRVKTRYKMAAHWQSSIVTLHPANDEVKKLLIENKDKESDIAKLDALKIMVDGVPASRTSLMKDPFLDKPESHGVQNLSTNDLNKAVLEYDKLGVASMMHVIGDQASVLALDAVDGARKANGVSGLRHHLTHCVVVDEKDMPRFKELDVVVDFSPFFPYRGTVHNNHIPAVGEEAFAKWYPVKSMMDHGVVVAIATDYPVTELNPFVNMESSVTRMDPHGLNTDQHAPEEAITVAQAIKAYTWNPAYILGWENEIGSIETGKLADMVILANNPFEVPAADISEIGVLKTLLSGEVIYDAEINLGQQIDAEESRLLALRNLKAMGHVCAEHS
ncbi:MAG: amidohydrolase [Pseudomonadales bacterium]